MNDIPRHNMLPIIKHPSCEVLHIHTSDRTTFKQCRRKWFFSSPLQLNLEKSWPNDKLWLGRIVHEALSLCIPAPMHSCDDVWMGYPTPQGMEDISLGHSPDIDDLEIVFDMCWRVGRAQLLARTEWQGLAPEQEDMLTSLHELGMAMMHVYRLWHKRNAKFTVTATEVPFSVPLHDYRSGSRLKATYDGHIDFVMVDEEDSRWLGEYKTVAQMRDPERLQFDEQWTSYLWAAEQCYSTRYKGVVYIEIKKKIPKIPDIVYGGTRVSCNKAIDTTPDVWLETLAGVVGWKDTLEALEMHVRRSGDANYIRMLDTLYEKEMQGKGYVRVTWVRHSQAEVDHVGKSIVHEYYDMRNPSHVVPTPTWDCIRRCDFKEACLAMNDGADVSEYLYGTGEFRERTGYYGDVRDE